MPSQNESDHRSSGAFLTQGWEEGLENTTTHKILTELKSDQDPGEG